ncbi:MAG TPA: hypothetical protein VL360_00470, partial [Gammaproteobacteria bacterium]|nr:hypothetical protein [Gammaproteobacteria bacterium]
IIGAATTLTLSLRQSRFAIYGMMLTAAIFLTTSLGSVRYVDTRTIRPLADILTPMLKPDSEVITYNQYYQDLPFYLQRRITILNWRNELEFGMQHQDTREWMIRNEQFFKKWNGKNQIFMIISKDEFQKFRTRYPNEPIIIISETPYNLLVSNRY